MGADLAAVIFGLGKELGALRRPFRVGRGDVGHLDVKERAGLAGSAGGARVTVALPGHLLPGAQLAQGLPGALAEAVEQPPSAWVSQRPEDLVHAAVSASWR